MTSKTLFQPKVLDDLMNIYMNDGLFFSEFQLSCIFCITKKNYVYKNFPAKVYLPKEVFVVKGLDLIDFAYPCPSRFVHGTRRDHTFILLMDWKISSPVSATPCGFISFE